MTTDAPTSAPKHRRRLRRLALAGAPVLLVLIVGGAWLARRPIAEAFVDGALRAQGVPAKVDIDGIGLHHLSGRARLGATTSPDAVIGRIEADIAVAPLFSVHPLAVTIIRVRLVRPTLVARVVNGKLSFGSLDGLISRLRPSAGGGPIPDIAIEQATLRLGTPAGDLVLAGGGLVRQGRIDTLDLRSGPATIQLGQTLAKLRAASLAVRTQGSGNVVDAHVALDRATGSGLDLSTGDLVAHVDGPVVLSPSPGVTHGKARVVVTAEVVRDGSAEIENLRARSISPMSRSPRSAGN